ncbi:MAG: hypothetical protein A2V62_11575 [Nitrospirae bacterium RBG_19FT_COMBO_58_9]|nr:MAG: hypothetical protein A2V62_11575 [Nitrospirae bacterium RBG_19FT_COMBO_58_9]
MPHPNFISGMSAHRSWEITQVNELLKQMEQFEGLFVCATNLMDRLNPAVLRRFDWEIQFGYFKPDQAEKLFTRVLADLQGYTRPQRYAESVKVRLLQLSMLTPGDFATVVRQARALGTSYDAEQLLNALEADARRRRAGGNR